ncbi:hypothetical protein HanHA89_Chr13g0501731 [Helianthus annuus]|nr:hypothetical protein HanHA89_Chr13g0501731 [Helianthus annuus]
MFLFSVQRWKGILLQSVSTTGIFKWNLRYVPYASSVWKRQIICFHLVRWLQWSGKASAINWCSPPFLVFFSIRDVVKWHNHNRLGAREKEVMQGIVIIACWRIWKARNDKVYNGKDCKIEEIIGDIKALGFLWYAHRSKFKFTEWLKWCKFSFVWLRFGADFSVVSVRCCCVLVWVVYKIRLSKKKKS